MDLILSSTSLEDLTLEDIKEKLNILEKRYLDSLDKNLEGDITLLNEINKYRELKFKKLNNSFSNKHTSNTKSISNNEEVKYKKDVVIDSIKLDSMTGFWIISYHENGRTLTEKFPYHQNHVDLKNRVFSHLKEKYGTKHLNQISIGLHSTLKEFDKKHETSEATKYLREKTNYIVTYNLKDIFKTNIYDFKEKTRLLIEAYRQKKYKGAIIEKPKFSYITGTIVVGSFLLALTGIHSLRNTSKDINVTTSTKTETTNDSFYPTEEEISNQVTIKNPDDKIKKSEQKSEVQEYLIHDKLDLDRLKLTDRVVNETISTDIKSLTCDYYKISLISVVSDNEIKELEEADFLENKPISNIVADYKEKYGNNINIFVNLDGYKDSNEKVYSTIGWTNIEQLESDNGLTTRRKIEYLKQIRNIVVSDDRTSKNKILQKTL